MSLSVSVHHVNTLMQGVQQRRMVNLFQKFFFFFFFFVVVAMSDLMHDAEAIFPIL